MSLKQEADRLEDLARKDLPAARVALDAILDRAKRLSGDERDAAMSFNAMLMTDLRERGVRLFDYSAPDFKHAWPA